MEDNIKKYTGKHYNNHATVVLMIFVALLGFWYVKSYARSIQPVRTFSVQGEGKIIAIPDIAEVSVSVLTEGGKNLSALQEENTKKTNSVIVFLKKHDVEKEDIKTINYSISPRYQTSSCSRPVFGEVEPCPPPEIVGYSIRQNILIKVRNLDEVGAIVAGVVDSGANSISGPNFAVDNPEVLQNEAKEKAIRAAREKAKTLAKAGGFKLGKPVSINEGFVSPFGARVALESFSVSDMGIGGSPSPSIEPGSQEIQASISVTYEIR